MRVARERPAWLYVLSSAAGPMSAVLTVPLLARGLGVEGRGDVAETIALLTTLQVVSVLGGPVRFSRWFSEDIDGIWRVVVKLLWVSLAAACLAVPALAAVTTGLSLPTRSALAFAVPLGLCMCVLQGISVGTGARGWNVTAYATEAVGRVGSLFVLFSCGALNRSSAALALAFAPLAGIAVLLPPAVNHLRSQGRGGAADHRPPASFRALFGVSSIPITQELYGRSSLVLVGLSASSRVLGLLALAWAISEPVLLVGRLSQQFLLVTAKRRRPGHDVWTCKLLTIGAGVAFALLAWSAVVPLVGLQFADSRAPAILLVVGSTINAIWYIDVAVDLRERDRGSALVVARSLAFFGGVGLGSIISPLWATPVVCVVVNALFAGMARLNSTQVVQEHGRGPQTPGVDLKEVAGGHESDPQELLRRS